MFIVGHGSTGIGKTDVGLADSCFHESTINALRYYSNHGYSRFFETAEFCRSFVPGSTQQMLNPYMPVSGQKM